MGVVYSWMTPPTFTKNQDSLNGLVKMIWGTLSIKRVVVRSSLGVEAIRSLRCILPVSGFTMARKELSWLAEEMKCLIDI